MLFSAAILFAALPVAFGQAALYGQCGGVGWSGATGCVSGSCCTFSNDYYSQCTPCNGNANGGVATTATTQASTTLVTKTSTSAQPATTSTKAASISWNTLSNVKIFGPGSGFTAPGVLYARTAIIGNTLFATAENYNSGLPVSPIYKSTDAGKTWSHLADVKDTVNGWGLTWEPHLYVLPEKIGNYPAGTLLLAIDSVPKARTAYKIDLYASQDQGATWKFVSNVAKGGGDLYEPFMVVYQGQLVVYFSDSRDTRYSQKLTHVTSTDLLTWKTNVDDVTSSNKSDRPGMATVAALPNGQWIMTYELVLTSSNTVWYKIANSPLNFLSATAQKLVAGGTTATSGSPYVVWSSTGGSSGTVVVSFAGSGNLFTNKNLGVSGSWVQQNTNVPGCYSRGLMVLPDPTKLLIVGAGWNGNSMNSQVRADIVTIN